MIGLMYPFWSGVIAIVTAQLFKPIFHFLRKREWTPRIILESGGFPSSHTAAVFALCLAVGVQENFYSTIFSVTLIFSIIIAYDAANVRYYAGQNIQVTHQLIKDIQELTALEFDDPIYAIKVKEVLGHKWIEVIAGGIWGILVATILLYFK